MDGDIVMVSIIYEALHTFVSDAQAHRRTHSSAVSATTNTDGGGDEGERELACDYMKMLHGLTKRAADSSTQTHGKSRALLESLEARADVLVSVLVDVLYAAFDLHPHSGGSGSTEAESASPLLLLPTTHKCTHMGAWPSSAPP